MIAPLVWLSVGIFTWTGALTFCLPLTIALLLNQTFRKAFISWNCFGIIKPFFCVALEPARKKAFRILKDSIGDRKRNLPHEILELGIGHGMNFEFYPENCNLTALDKSALLEAHVLENVKQFPHISHKRTVVQPAEDMSEVADCSVDIVVSTYLHCSVKDSNAILREVKRVLKPGGKYLFLDHVRFSKNDVGFYIQKLMGPIWALIFNECALDRDIAAAIKGAGFSEVKCEAYVSPDLMIYLLSQQVVGIAIK